MVKQIYLDYAAATPVEARVLKAMAPYWSRKFYNPSATYLTAKSVAADLAQARKRIAAPLGVRASEIVFTAGGTEANNLAINGVMASFPRGNLVVSSIEHHSVLRPAGLYKSRSVMVRTDGIIDLADLKKKIDDQTVLVSIMYANNEIGTIQPIRKIASMITTIRDDRLKKGDLLPIYLHSDACQAAAYLDLHVSKLGVDLMTINGGKIYGSKQSGVLMVKAGITLKPQILGGGQERGLRGGTENVATAVGLAEALDIVQTRRQDEARRLKQLQDLFISELSKHIPQAIVNGSTKNRLPNNIHITLPGRDNERLIMQLDEMGIMCAEGSACSASDEEPSHVLKAIGLSDADAKSSLRFSTGVSTTETDIRRTIQALKKCV